MSDKVILSNGSALLTKYKPAGVKAISAAVNALIVADKKRGLNTQYIELDDSGAMEKLKGAAVTNANDANQNKQAIDAVYKALAPDYIVLLGAIDVIPHVPLVNPLYNPNKPDDDSDKSVPSDLPYACESGYSAKIEDFTGPTRVVGRLPDIAGASDPGYLTALLATAASYQSRPRSAYAKYLGISASVWKKSTALSLEAIFGNSADEKVAPPSLPPWSTSLLARRAHFINCHGADTDPHFYGQKGNNFPISYDASQLTGKLSEGVVAAMECCYGAELYEPSKLQPPQPGIANTYLANQAYGYLGSTTIAYGPSDSNDWADLLCRNFLINAFSGASLGRALLEARQKYIQDAPTPIGPVDLKTLAQFNLLGDPSVVPVAAPPPLATAKLLGARGAAGVAAVGRASRVARRKDLRLNGLSLARTWPTVTSRPTRSVTGAVLRKLNAMAKQMGMSNPSILTFKSRKPAGAAPASKALVARVPDVDAVHVMIQRQPAEEHLNLLVALVVRESAGQMTAVRKGFGR